MHTSRQHTAIHIESNQHLASFITMLRGSALIGSRTWKKKKTALEKLELTEALQRSDQYSPDYKNHVSNSK